MQKISTAPAPKGVEPSRFKVALVALAFLVASSPVVFRDRPDVFNLAMAVTALLLLMASKGRVRMNAGVAVLVVWAAASLLWTSDFATSLDEVIALVVTAVAALAAATFQMRVVVRGLLLGSVGAVLASLALGVLLPGEGRSARFGGALIGIYGHRNFLASVTAVALALSLAAVITASSRRARIRAVIAVALSASASIATLSGSAIVLAVAVIFIGAVMWFGRAVGPYGRLGCFPLLAVLLGGFGIPWLVQTLPALTAGVGRDETLTGRTDIWAIVIDLWADRPFTGYGWGGVWRGPLGEFVRALFGFDTALSAHNGYLDVLLQIGLVGAAVFATVLLAAIVRSIRLTIGDNKYLWLPLVLTAVLVNSLTESQLTRPAGIFLIVLISAIACKELRALRQPADVTDLAQDMPSEKTTRIPDGYYLKR